MSLNDDILRAQSDQAAIELVRKQMRDKQNPYSFGGSVDAYQNAVKGYRDQAVAPMAQDRITADPSMYSADRGLIGQSQGAQSAGLDYWKGMASGTGPSAGADAYRQNLTNTMANNQSIAAGARGGAYSTAAAGQAAGQFNAGAAMRAPAELDAIRAQEQMQGAQGYMNAAGTMRAGAQGAQGLSSTWANDAANQGLKQQQQDLAWQRYMTGLANQTNMDQQSGATKGLLTEMGQTEAARQIEAQDRQRQGQMTGAIVQTGGQLVGQGLGSLGRGSEDPKRYGYNANDGSYWDPNGKYHP